jgi:hypothetical protein
MNANTNTINTLTVAQIEKNLGADFQDASNCWSFVSGLIAPVAVEPTAEIKISEIWKEKTYNGEKVSVGETVLVMKVEHTTQFFNSPEEAEASWIYSVTNRDAYTFKMYNAIIVEDVKVEYNFNDFGQWSGNIDDRKLTGVDA